MNGRFIFFLSGLIIFVAVDLAQAQIAPQQSLQDQQKRENQQEQQQNQEDQQKQQQQTANFQSLEQQQQGELSGGVGPNPNLINTNNSVVTSRPVLKSLPVAHSKVKKDKN